MQLKQVSNKLKRLSDVFSQDGLLKGLSHLIRGILGVFRALFKKVKEYVIISLYKIKSKEGQIVKLILGNQMYLNVNDPGISRELLLRGIREDRTTALIKKELTEGMVIVDIGANIGYYALIEASQIGESGHVYAIEPVPSNFQLLSKNVKINGYNNISLYNIAMSDKNETAEFSVTTASNWGTMIDYSSDDTSDYFKKKMDVITTDVINVDAFSFDDFVESENINNVDLIRMDIEGYEINVVNGMMKSLEKFSPPVKLLIEVHNSIFTDPLKSLGPLFENLMSIGFRAKVLIAKKDVYYDISNDKFISLLCSYDNLTCHLLMEKV